MKRINRYLIFLLVFSLCFCTQVETQIECIDILYNSEKYGGSQYEVTINPKIIISNNNDKDLYIKKNEIDSLNIIINRKKYLMILDENKYDKEILLKPNSKLLFEYSTYFREAAKNYDDQYIDSIVSLSEIRDKKKKKINKSSNFKTVSWMKAYIKETYYTPNGTKIEKIGE